jgi:hypothetical protein
MGLGSKANLCFIISAQEDPLSRSGASLLHSLRRIDNDNSNKRLMQTKAPRRKRGR